MIKDFGLFKIHYVLLSEFVSLQLNAWILNKEACVKLAIVFIEMQTENL